MTITLARWATSEEPLLTGTDQICTQVQYICHRTTETTWHASSCSSVWTIITPTASGILLHFRDKKKTLKVISNFNQTPVRIQPGIRNSYDVICMSSFSYRHLLLRVHFVVQMSPHLQVAGSPNLGICSHVLSIRCRDHKEKKECRRSCQHSDSDLSTTSTDPAKTIPIINVSVSSY